MDQKSRYSLVFLPELNGMRGVAILGVMLGHAGLPFLKGGGVGVDIFFVLSGFLISSLLVEEFDRYQSINLKYFYMRRVLRLAPALISLLLVFCVWSCISLTEERAYSNYIDALIALFYSSNWARAFSIHPPAYLGHTWSLSVEEQFYIIWPILLWLMLRFSKQEQRYRCVIYTLVLGFSSWLIRFILLIAGASAERLFNGLDTRADALMIGCALGIAVTSGLIKGSVRFVLSKALVFLAPLSALTLIGFAQFSRWRDPAMYSWGFLLVEISTAALILDVLLNPDSIVRKVLSARWLVWLGTISYGVYLWHYPIYYVMYENGCRLRSVAIAGSMLTILLSSISYHALERPILRMKENYTRRVRESIDLKMTG